MEVINIWRRQSQKAHIEPSPGGVDNGFGCALHIKLQYHPHIYGGHAFGISQTSGMHGMGLILLEGCQVREAILSCRFCNKIKGAEAEAEAA